MRCYIVTTQVAGHVELFLQWVYNPVTAFDPFAPSETEGEPNELRIGLGRARDLPAMDKALVGKSSSDPRCTFTVDGTAIKLQSSTKKSTLTPTWKETFEVPLPKGPPETKWELVIDMEDWDRVRARVRNDTGLQYFIHVAHRYPPPILWAV